MSAFVPARILLPSSGIDYTRWAVIACDQFTSEPEYWDALDRQVGGSPSTLRLILPEAYLDRDPDQVIPEINQKMADYLAKGLLSEVGVGMVLVERQTPFVPKRLGLVLAVDLEAYSYQPGSHPQIRATEQTVAARIPPRVKIREHAPIELPHVLLLINDPEERIIETLYARRENLRILYDFELNMGGGHLRGWWVSDTASVLSRFETLISPVFSQRHYGDPQAGLLALVGDGNHSLASAKAHWDQVKKTLSPERQKDHPARYALVEVENLYDEGLRFEPIHRVVFHPQADFLPGLQALAGGDYAAEIYSKAWGSVSLALPAVAPDAIRRVQETIDAYVRSHPGCEVDYVHGMDHLRSVCDKNPDAVGISLPPLAKADLFPYVLRQGVLPRKSFSMGEAVEKRYYVESKAITE
jgi:hypothetical protein